LRIIALFRCVSGYSRDSQESQDCAGLLRRALTYGDLPRVSPPAIQSFTLNNREDRSNSAQTGIRLSTLLRPRGAQRPLSLLLIRKLSPGPCCPATRIMVGSVQTHHRAWWDSGIPRGVGWYIYPGV